MNTLFHTSVGAMNTKLDLVWWGMGADVSRAASEAILQTIDAIELVLSRYDEQSELFALNRIARDHIIIFCFAPAADTHRNR
jgi:hypothetical protein